MIRLRSRPLGAAPSGLFAVLLANLILAAPAANGPTIIDDTDPAVVYSLTQSPVSIGAWLTEKDQRDYMGSAQLNNLARLPAPSVQGAAAVVNFNGTDITWIGKTGPNFGIASISIDGGAPFTFDAYTPSAAYQTPNAVISGLSPGSHALKVEVTAGHHRDSTDVYQAIDAFQLQGQPLTFNDAQTAGWNYGGVVLNGKAWSCGSNPADLSGGQCQSNHVGDSASWTFTGSLVEVYGRPDLEDGIYDVKIDDTHVTFVDGSFGTVDDDALTAYPLFIASVSPGTHTIELVIVGQEPNAADAFLQLDLWAAFP